MSGMNVGVVLVGVVFSAALLWSGQIALAEDDRPPAPGPSGKDLVRKLKEGNLLFVATVKQAKPVAMTASMPPSYLMEITFSDLKMLRGNEPAKPVFSYSTRNTANPALATGKKVIVSANESKESRGILVIVEATEENLKSAEAAK